MLQIPTLIDGTRSYVIQVELDGTTFQFVFNWNDREGRWYFDLNDIQGLPLVSGRAVVLGLPLLGRFKQATLPEGDLICIDTSGSNIDASLTDLGDRVLMIYVAAADLAAINAGTFTPS
jgi:hypothetical protein